MNVKFEGQGTTQDEVALEGSGRICFSQCSLWKGSIVLFELKTTRRHCGRMGSILLFHGVLAILAGFIGACASDRVNDLVQSQNGDVDGSVTMPSTSLAASYVQIEIGGEACVDCWRRLAIENEELVLEDAQGEERFGLKAREVDLVQKIVSSANFLEAQEDLLPCRGTFGTSTVLTVRRENGATFRDPDVGGCIGNRESPKHPFNELAWALIDLKRAYLECPKVEPIVQWDTDQPPPIRMLCFACGGEC